MFNSYMHTLIHFCSLSSGRTCSMTLLAASQSLNLLISLSVVISGLAFGLIIIYDCSSNEVYTVKASKASTSSRLFDRTGVAAPYLSGSLR